MNPSVAAYEHNNQPTSREAFYAIACDPQRSVAVEACAGAGKTWMLVSRILRALLAGSAPHEILAITFTKKAAGEMRQRLNEWLVQFSNSSPEQLEHELLMRGINPQAARDLREPLQNLYQTLLMQGRPVQIRTFHSWFAALLRTAPLAVLETLGLPANYELLEDDAPAVALVWRRFYAALLRDEAQSQAARQDFEAVVAAHGRFQTEKALAGALSKRVEFALADAQGVLETSVPHCSEQFADLFIENPLPQDAKPDPILRHSRAGEQPDAPLAVLLAPGPLQVALWAAAKTLGRAPQPSFSAKGSELEAALTHGDAPGILVALMTKEGPARKFNDKVPGIEQVRDVQAQVLRVQAAQVQHEAWLYQQRMTRLTRVLLNEFAALKRERGWVDMNDVERAAQHLLCDPVLGGWVQERLDARIRHLLIDEFQDTSPLQWQALQAWLSGYAGAGGGAQAPSVFIVGDPKQSIYRFRRAEPQVFIAAQQFVVDHLNGELLSCDHTRRNAPPVMQLVNAVMGQAQAQGEFQGFRVHTTESTDAGAVLRLPQIQRPKADLKNTTEQDQASENWRDSLTTPQELPEETLRTLECRQAALWLAQQMGGGLHPRDIMVLARKRDRLAVMQDELRALHIPALQPEKADLGEAPEVQDIVALLDALVSPAHDLSLARALKSPLFGVSDEALVQLALLARQQAKTMAAMDASNSLDSHSSFPRRRESSPAESLDSRLRGNDGGKRPSWFALLQNEALLSDELKGIGPVLLQYKGWLDTLPPHDALDAIYQHADVLARFAAAAPDALRENVLANLQALLSAALQIDGARYATPYAFVRALRAGGVKAPERANADAVRLLTVHGAKGLEAALVLLLDTDAPSPKAQTMGVLVDWPGQASAPQSFMFLASETRAPASAESALTTENLARQREEINGLYVAMTRARHRIVLSSVQPHQAQEASWWQRLQGECEPTPADNEIGPEGAWLMPVRPELVEGTGMVQQPASFLLPVLPENQSPLQTVAIKSGVTDSPQSLIGQAMHRLLEWAALGAQHCPEAHVLQAAQEFGLNAPQAGQAGAMAQRILTGDGAWVWDGAQIDWHGNEVALTVQGQFRRLDRLVHRKPRVAGAEGLGLAGGEWWVLDYKSAAHALDQSALVAQLSSYRTAVQAIYPDQTVKAAFLSAQGTLDELND